jgi:hypothetical protein
MNATPAYPLPRPATNNDTRFSLGLALGIAAVLTRHGYPPLTAGADLVRLQQALFSLIYQPLDKASPIGNQIPPSRQFHGFPQLTGLQRRSSHRPWRTVRQASRSWNPLLAV